MLSDQEPNKKTAYSCYFEVQLKEENFGMSRKDHFKICNEKLLEHLYSLDAERIQLHSDVSNSNLAEHTPVCEHRSTENRAFSTKIVDKCTEPR